MLSTKLTTHSNHQQLEVDYPESDGLPMADNTKQFDAEARALEELFARADVEEALVQAEQASAEAEAHSQLESKLREAEEKLRKAGLLY